MGRHWMIISGGHMVDYFGKAWINNFHCLEDFGNLGVDAFLIVFDKIWI